jgi:hypothetical protein
MQLQSTTCGGPQSTAPPASAQTEVCGAPKEGPLRPRPAHTAERCAAEEEEIINTKSHKSHQRRRPSHSSQRHVSECTHSGGGPDTHLWWPPQQPMERSHGKQSGSHTGQGHRRRRPRSFHAQPAPPPPKKGPGVPAVCLLCPGSEPAPAK